MKSTNLIYAILLVVTIAGISIGVSLYFQRDQTELGVAIIIGSALLGAASLISGLNDAYDFIGKLRSRTNTPKSASKAISQVQSQNSANKEFSSFSELAQNIWPFMAENGRAFMNFGPNSGAATAGSLRWNLELWENAKIDIIVPNNKKILELVNNNWNLIPNQYRAVFDKMIAHIYAFEKHCEDPTFSYAEHQFPSLFAKIIDETCVQEEKKTGNVAQYEQWLNIWFQQLKSVEILDAYFVGSALRGHFPDSDVDLFILTNTNNERENIELVSAIETLKDEFLLQFHRPLHVMVFSILEKNEFYDFLENVGRMKQFSQFEAA